MLTDFISVGAAAITLCAKKTWLLKCFNSMLKILFPMGVNDCKLKVFTVFGLVMTLYV